MAGSPATFLEVQQEIKKGTLTCYERVKSYLTTIERKHHLNAFVEVYSAEALERASFVDSKIKNGSAGRLAGLVVGIKDVFAHEGHGLQAASRILQGFKSQFNATAVQRLLDEDAIIIGRQNCDEFAMGSSNENSAFGPVLNDIDNTRVSGGSSGGSAVAVMAGMCDVSLGSDTGGSVRQPAAFCGIFGIKPTYSRISRHGLVAYGSSFDCVGIFGKRLEDIGLVLEIISGADDFDSTVSRRKVPEYSKTLQQRHEGKFKVAILAETIGHEGMQPEVSAAFTRLTSAIKAQGHTVDNVPFPLLGYILPTYYILATAEASSNLSRYDGVRYGSRSADTHDLQSMYKKTRAEGFGKEVQRRILLGTFVLSASYYDAYYTKAQRVRRLIRDKTKEILQQYDFIMMPTAPTTAFKIGQMTTNPVEMYLADLFSVQANVAGIPALSLPAGYDNQGLPIGMQLMADDFEEEKLLRFANVLNHSTAALHA